MFKVIEQPNRILSCYFCERDIATDTHIFCDNCNIELCVYCFCQGKQLKKHKRNHKYVVIQDLEYKIFEDNWSAFEELKFLQGLLVFGYGNWEDVAKYISTEKDAIQVEKHWQFCYNDFLDENDKNFTINNRIKFLQKQKNKKFEIEFQPLLEIKKQLLQNSIQDAYQFAQEQNFDISENNNSIQGEILGFMPLRQEFDVEYDNEAELLLAEMEFLDTDSNEEYQIKLNILKVYNDRLKERQKRKNLVIQKNLLNLKKKQEEEKNMSKQEYKIRKFLRPYERLLNEEELNEFVNLQLEEIQISDRIKEVLYLEEKGNKIKLNDDKNFQSETYLNQKFSKLDLKQDLNKLIKEQNDINLINQIQLTNLNAKKAKIEEDENLNFCEQEIKMCQDLNIELDDYIIIKEALVRQNIGKGFVERSQFIDNINFPNQQVVEKIIDLHEEYNLIRTKQLITYSLWEKLVLFKYKKENQSQTVNEMFGQNQNESSNQYEENNINFGNTNFIAYMMINYLQNFQIIYKNSSKQFNYEQFNNFYNEQVQNRYNILNQQLDEYEFQEINPNQNIPKKNLLQYIFKQIQDDSKENFQYIIYFTMVAKRYYEMIKVLNGLKQINCYGLNDKKSLESFSPNFQHQYNKLIHNIEENKINDLYQFANKSSERILGQQENENNKLENPFQVLETTSFMQQIKGQTNFLDIIQCQPFLFFDNPVFLDNIKFNAIFNDLQNSESFQITTDDNKKITIQSNQKTLMKLLGTPKLWEIYQLFKILLNDTDNKIYKKVSTQISGQLEQQQKENIENQNILTEINQNPGDISNSQTQSNQIQNIQNQRILLGEQNQNQLVENDQNQKIENVQNQKYQDDEIEEVIKKIKQINDQKVQLKGQLLSKIFLETRLNIDLEFIIPNDNLRSYEQFQLYKNNTQQFQKYLTNTFNYTDNLLSQYLQLHQFLLSYFQQIYQKQFKKKDDENSVQAQIYIPSCIDQGQENFLSSQNQEKPCPLFFKYFFIFMSKEVKQFKPAIILSLLNFSYVHTVNVFQQQINLIVDYFFVFCTVLFDAQDSTINQKDIEKYIKIYIDLAVEQINEDRQNEQRKLKKILIQFLIQNNK